MKTIIFDIDGTITDMWPLERAVLVSLLGKQAVRAIEEMHESGLKDTYVIFCKVSKKTIGKRAYRALYNRKFALLERQKLLPRPKPYPIVGWIRKNSKEYHFVYATGGQSRETRYVLSCLKIGTAFDVAHSLDAGNYRFSKRTGLPFKKIGAKFPNCLLVTDGRNDCEGALRARIPYIHVKDGARTRSWMRFHATIAT